MNPRELLDQAQARYREGKLADSSSLCKQYLAQFPRDVNAIRLYANLAERMDKSEEATVIYHKLLALLPEDLDSLNALAWHYFHIEQYRSARQFAERALRVAPQSAQALWTLGALTLVEGDETHGRALLEQARSLGADSLAIDETLFDDLIAKGRFEDARELARRLIDQFPKTTRLYGKLARASQFTADSADTTLIRSLLDRSGVLRAAFGREDRDRVEAYRALYKLESDLGNYSAAFAHLEKMKEPLRKAAPAFNRDEMREHLDLIRQVYTREFIATRAAHATDADDPIFVVGMPRSGTTLLERALATAPGVVAAGERGELNQVKEKLCAHFGENQYDQAALRNAPLAMWRQVGEEYIKRVRLNLADGTHFVDKMPGNYGNIGFIRSILPRARIIHISRHPVATCFSIYEQNFGVRHAYNLDQQSLGEYYLGYVAMMAYWRELLPDGFLEVRYEELVTDPASVINTLSEQLDMQLDMDALARSQASGAIHTASYWQARQPVNQASVERWTRYREQLQPLIDVLQPLLLAQEL